MQKKFYFSQYKINLKSVIFKTFLTCIKKTQQFKSNLNLEILNQKEKKLIVLELNELLNNVQ